MGFLGVKDKEERKFTHYVILYIHCMFMYCTALQYNLTYLLYGNIDSHIAVDISSLLSFFCCDENLLVHCCLSPMPKRLSSEL